MIDRILEEDKKRPAKQQHSSKRIFERIGSIMIWRCQRHSKNTSVVGVRMYHWKTQEGSARSLRRVLLGYATTLAVVAGGRQRGQVVRAMATAATAHSGLARLASTGSIF